MYIFFLFFLLLNSTLQSADLPEPIDYNVWGNNTPLPSDEAKGAISEKLETYNPLVDSLFLSPEEEFVEKNDPLIVPNSPFLKRKNLRCTSAKLGLFECIENPDTCQSTFSTYLNLLSHCSLHHKDTKLSTPEHCLNCRNSGPRSIPRRFSYRSTAHRGRCTTINNELDHKNNRDLITKKRNKLTSKKSASDSTPSTQFRCIEDPNTCSFISSTYRGLRAHCSRFHKNKKLSYLQTCLECSGSHNNPRSFCYVSLEHLSLCHIINQELNTEYAQKKRRRTGSSTLLS